MMAVARVARWVTALAAALSVVALASCSDRPEGRSAATRPLRGVPAPAAVMPTRQMPVALAAAPEPPPPEVFHLRVPNPTFVLDDYHARFHLPGCGACPPEGPWAFGTSKTRDELEDEGHYKACRYCLGPLQDQTSLQGREQQLQRPDAFNRPSDLALGGSGVASQSRPPYAESDPNARHSNVCLRCGDGPYQSSTGKWHSNPSCADHER